MKIELMLSDKAIYKASLEPEPYNYFRYSDMKRDLQKTGKITMAEFMDIKLYLGHSMD